MLRDGGRPTTARELRTAVAQLRDHLRAAHQPGSRIALLGGCDPHTAMLWLAAQLAGCVVTVLDRRSPAEVVRTTLETFAPDAVLTVGPDAGTVAGVPGAVDGGRLVRAAWADARTLPDPGPLEPGAGTSLVLFSSGSTGAPKGVVHSHETLAAMALALDAHVDVTGSPCIGITQPLGYVTANTALAGAWRTGRCVSFMDVGAHGLEGFVGWLVADGVTTVRVQVAVMRSLCALEGLSSTGLGFVGLGGEALRAGDLARARAALPPGCVVRFSYGSTELSSVASIWLPPDAELAEPVWLTTVAGVHVTALPSAVEGVDELVVSSPSLALGYLGGLPADHARFETVDGCRRLRTGDTVRIDGDRICLTGRVDDRLKVRGSNVEPATVEEVLAEHPGVREVCVVGLTRPDGSTVLHAEFVPATAPPPSAGELRGHVRRRLAEQFVPAVVRLVADLPRSAGGKVDRRAVRDRAMTGLRTPAEPRRSTRSTIAPRPSTARSPGSWAWGASLPTPTSSISASTPSAWPSSSPCSPGPCPTRRRSPPSSPGRRSGRSHGRLHPPTPPWSSSAPQPTARRPARRS